MHTDNQTMDFVDDFSLIWHRYPERQISHSSVWWFFLLLPKGPQGYGPKQMMFTLFGIAGNTFKLNHVEHLGMGPQLTMKDGEEHFNGFAQGWVFDGQQMHKDVIYQAGQTLLAPHNLACWVAQANGQLHGGGMCPSGNKPFGIAVKFTGASGAADFEVWGDPGSQITEPVAVHDYNTPLGGSQVVAWRRLRFAGEFAYPAGTEYLEGLGYFQRVCLNIPPVPWKWIWAAFEDESVFSCFTIYAGPHLFRTGDELYPNVLEQVALPLRDTNYFYCSASGKMFEFDTTKVTPIVGGQLPHFLVECRSTTGDFIRYRAVPHSHMQNVLDRPLVKGLWRSRYNYNEYLFRIEDLAGRVGERDLNQKTVGNGFGNCEYTWGLGLG